jgi:hypothetical protein
MFKGPVINKAAGSLGARAASEQNIHGMVMGGVVGAGTYSALNATVKLIQPSDADAMGLTSAYDAANKILVRYHIDEYFRLNPNGELWLQLVAQGTSLASMCTYGSTNGVKKLINDSNKKVKTVGVVLNPLAAYAPTLTNGIDVDVTNAVPLAQTLVESFIDFNCYIDHIVIEGREVNGTIATIKDLRTLDSENVHVCILQDKDIADLDVEYAPHAAVGTTLGMIGIRRIEEDYGSINVLDNPNKGVENFSLSDGVSWVNVAISSGTLVKNLTAAEIEVLNDNGFIFADEYPEYSGYYLNKSSACTALTSDFAYGNRMRVWNAGARIVTKMFIPLYNSNFDTTAGGKIAPIVATEWETKINNPRTGLGSLAAENHCQETAVFIDPEQEIDANEANVEIGMEIKVFNTVRSITGTLKLTI